MTHSNSDHRLAQENPQERYTSSATTNLLGYFLVFAISLASGIVLARLIRPASFGLFAIVEAVIAFTETFRTLGLREAITQQDDLEPHHLNRLFWLSIRLSLVFAAGLFVVAPLISTIYQEPLLWPLISLMALVLMLRSLTTIQEGILQRQMSFRSLITAEILGLTVGSLFAILAALAGVEFWALLLREFIRYGVICIFLWLVCDWRPGSYSTTLTAVDTKSVQRFFSFGGYHSLSRMIGYLGRNFDSLAIGFFLGNTALGYYSKAYRWSIYPLRQVHIGVLNVALSSMSRLKHDNEALMTVAKNLMLPVFTLSMGLLGFFFLEAESIIQILLGDQWVESIILFRILCVAAFAASIEKVTRWFYLAYGDTKREFSWYLRYTPIMIALVLLGAQVGVVQTALAYTAGTVFLTLPSLVYCLRATPFRLVDVLSVAAHPLLTTVITVGILYQFVLPHIPGSGLSLLNVCLRALIYAFVFLCIWLLLPGGRAKARSIIWFVKSSLNLKTEQAVT